MKIKYLSLLLTGLLIAPVIHGQIPESPKLQYKLASDAIEIAGFEDRKPYGIQNGKKRFLSTYGVFQLVGDVNALSDYAYFTPNFEQNKETGSKGISYTTVFNLGTHGKNKDGGKVSLQNLKNLWNIKDDRQIMFVIAWIDPQETLHRINFFRLDSSKLPKDSKFDFHKRFKHQSKSRLVPAIMIVDLDGQLVQIPNKTYATDTKSLMVALINDDAETITNLLSDNAILADKEFMDFKPIHMAASWGAFECLDLLIDNGVDPNEPSALSHYPIHMASSTERENIVQKLIKQGVSVSKKNGKDHTPLHIAAQRDARNIAELLIDAGSKKNAKDGFKRTPAMMAANQGNISLFRFLNEQGSKFPLTTHNKQLLLLKAIRQADAESVAYMLDHWSSAKKSFWGQYPIFEAAKHAGSDVMNLLLEDGAKPNRTRASGVTPLMIASQYRLDTVKTLLEAGADINVLTTDGVSALHVAILHKQLEITDFLLQNGADPNLKNPDGTPLLWLATSSDNREGLHQLINAGATCSMTPETALPIMEYAFQYDIPEIVEITLSQCLQPDFNFYDQFPSYWVAKYYKSEAIQELLKNHGVEPAVGVPPKLVPSSDVAGKVILMKKKEVPYPSEYQETYGEFMAKVSIIINTDGKVILPKIMSNPAPELNKSIMETLKTWEFAPIEYEGEYVCSRFVLPLKFVPKPQEEKIFEVQQAEQKPRPVRQVAPVYPSSLKKRKVSGQVNLIFVVDQEGNVVDPRVELASHEAFVAPALACIKRWKFQPGYIDAEPVKVRVRAPMIFRVN